MNKIGNNSLANRCEYNRYVPFSFEDDITFFHAILLDDIEDYQTFDQFEPNNILDKSSNQQLELDIDDQELNNQELEEKPNFLIGLFGVGVITTALLAAIKKII